MTTREMLQLIGSISCLVHEVTSVPEIAECELRSRRMSWLAVGGGGYWEAG